MTSMMITAPATTPVATPAIVPFDTCWLVFVCGAAVVVAAEVDEAVLLARVDVDSVDEGIVI